MILLLGASGYIGQGFARELVRREWPFIGLSRREVDYTRFDLLLEYLEARQPNLVINAAGFTGKPNVDACEDARAETLAGNTLLPLTIAHACAAAGIPWGHVSSGCIYSGAKIVMNGHIRVEKDLTRPELRALVEQSPECISRFHRDGRVEFFLPPSALQLLQRHQGTGGGGPQRHRTKLHLAPADSLR